jgi:hypothetical protein
MLQWLVGCIHSFDGTLIESSKWMLQKVKGKMWKVKEAGDVQSASSKNYKTLTLTILGRGEYKSSIKRV